MFGILKDLQDDLIQITWASVAIPSPEFKRIIKIFDPDFDTGDLHPLVEMDQHLRQWCAENIKGKFTSKYYIGTGTAYEGVRYYFQKPKDAMFFKLTWGGTGVN